MDFANFWFSSGAGGGGGYEIANSLRFRGAQYLQRTPASAGDRTTFTWSGWVKSSKQTNDCQFFSAGSAFANYDLFRFTGDTGTYKNNLEFYSNVNAAYQRSNAKYRDPGSWYHVVGTLDTNNATAVDRLRIYINGERINSWQGTISLTQGRTMNYFNTANQHRIGLRAHSTSAYPTQWADGYMAEIHFVDGQALEPTDFGEYNDDGVWVPKSVTGLTYGTNGFYLDFSDPSDIGADRSGNGNNWTPTGFELTNTSSNDYDWMSDSPTQNEATWNPNLGYSPSANTNPNTFAKANRNVTTVTNSSNGSEQSWGAIAVPTAAGGKYYWELENVGSTNNIFNGVQAVDSVGTAGSYSMGPWNAEPAPQWGIGSSPTRQDFAASNGATATGTGSASYNISQRLGFLLDLDNNTLEFRNNNTTIGTLTNCNFADFAFLSPFAQNYTKTSSTASSVMMLRTGDLRQYTVSGYNDLSTAGLPDVAITNPSEHFQTVLGSGPDTGATPWSTVNTAVSVSGGQLNDYDGLANSQHIWTRTDTTYPPFDFVRHLNDSNYEGYSDWYVPSKFELDLAYRNLKPTTETNSPYGVGANNYAVPQVPAYTSTVPAQTTVAAFQAPSGAQRFNQGTGYNPGTYYSSSPPSTNAANGIAFDSSSIQAGYNYNSGQKYSPYGKTRAFRREAYTGSEPAIGTAYAGGYFAGLYSLNGDNVATHAIIVADKATGENGGILTLAQNTFPSGLWWVKDRQNSNQHQLVDSVRGGNLALQCPSTALETAYVAPAGNSVAWCWNAPDAFTGSGGTISSSGYRNTAAGFSIVSYQGTGSFGTVAHGLSQAPDLVIVKLRQPAGASGFTGSFVVAHKDIDIANQTLGLNSSAAPQAYGSGWVNALSASTFNVTAGTSDIDNVSRNGNNYIAYCWHSVPGYSSIGSYVGNGNSDGPFIYTGFRPAFVMIKATNANDWYIFDTARGTYNPTTTWLKPNTDGTEGANSSTDQWDILSNGFKPRNLNGNQNGSGTTFIYMAFAEHPFGGANVSPSPAR